VTRPDIYAVAPDIIRSFLELLSSNRWHDQAACAGSELNWLPDTGTTKDLWDSGFLLAPLLTCESCVVRRDCLKEGLRTWNAPHAQESKTRKTKTEITRSFGIWGGTIQKERMAVEHLPISEAADILEAGFPERIERRIAAWKAHRAARKPKITKAGKPYVHNVRSDRIILALLERRARRGAGVTSTAPLPACSRCGEKFSWRTRSDARYCSSRCRQADYRSRLAA
jgi:hypothetical protein